MSGLWSTLEDIEKRIERAATAVHEAVRPRPAKGRELVCVLQQVVDVTRYNLAVQQATFYNGDVDTIVISRLSAEVQVNDASASPLGATPFRRVSMARVEEGYQAITRRTNNLAPEFDFMWNYAVQSRGSMYSRDWALSDLLAGSDRGKGLEFRTPLRIPRGESVTFLVKPLRFAVPTSSGDVTVGPQAFYVNFIGLGHREMP